MVQLLPALLTLITAIAVSGSPLPVAEAQGEIEARACAYTCGSVCYQSTHITAALNRGYSLQQAGSDVNNYPHRYNNYEGFNFPTSGPWYEFPIMSSYKVYNGGSPGPDRVIFDDDGAFDMLITHTGASGNAFVACRRG
ncbi:ribonuclease-domain-containing protein [Canariomyces notabilis]|uniref:ribonuclease T1 n=1 Tax=Canariomyces notabilis TaxID=2074819 RepID=A0AAN6THR0_9PEZI|nr:ribonuclease-domain-containing protein [Canariomyces arenarius]